MTTFVLTQHLLSESWQYKKEICINWWMNKQSQSKFSIDFHNAGLVWSRSVSRVQQTIPGAVCLFVSICHGCWSVTWLMQSRYQTMVEGCNRTCLLAEKLNRADSATCKISTYHVRLNPMSPFPRHMRKHLMKSTHTTLVTIKFRLLFCIFFFSKIWGCDFPF